MRPNRIAASLLVSMAASFPLRAGELVFDQLEAPRTEAEKLVPRAITGAMIDGKRVELAFQPLLQGGVRYGAGTFAASLKADGTPVKDGKGQALVSTYPDFTSLIQASGQLLGVTHFESLPSALYITRFNQDRRSGMLSVAETRSLRLAHIGGIYNPCAGMVTPWGTHLGGEEYPPDMRLFEVAVATADKAKLSRWIPQAIRYFDINPQTPDFAAIKARFKPYRYGFPFEVRVKGFHAVEVVRHHAMGRFSHELAYVMPDRRTVYMSDDGDNGGFFMFVADRPGDLSSGKLYAARWEQTSPVGDKTIAANLNWIDLGHATSAAIAREIEGGVTFASLFDAADMPEDGACPTGFSAVNFVGDQTRRSGECLKVRPGKEVIASRLESRRYAAVLGATTEFNKAEGITFDPKRKRLMLSITSIDRGMGDSTEKGKPSTRFERGGPNHIRLAYNPCGVVFGLELQRDDKVGSDYVARTMAPLVSGEPIKAEGNAAHSCALDGIAGPDNITFIPEHDTLIIAEDSGGGHENDAVWAYDVEKAKPPRRLMTVPLGAEASGVYWHRGINGFSYLTVVVQHPFPEADTKSGAKPPNDDPKHRAGLVGVIGPFPSAVPAKR